MATLDPKLVLGAYAVGRELDEVSALDLSRMAERDVGAFCRQGYGGLLAKLAEGIPVALDSAVTDIEFPSAGVAAVTSTVGSPTRSQASSDPRPVAAVTSSRSSTGSALRGRGGRRDILAVDPQRRVGQLGHALDG